MSRPRLTRESHLEFEADCPMAERLAALSVFDPDANPELTRTMRLFMEMLGAPVVCPRGRCRRADRCLTRKVDCAFRLRPWLDANVFPDWERD